jgi:ATP-dependent exoDNAse (exonuclease V) alpha subunit
LVFPLGEFDDQLLAPMIEWMKKKIKNRIEKSNQKKASSVVEPIKLKKMSITAKTKNLLDELEKLDKSKKEKETQPILVDKFDPFKRTGTMFGCLFKEIKYRYSKYLTDIADGLNVHCLIASVFIFTVCIAPALCFGGILGI